MEPRQVREVARLLLTKKCSSREVAGSVGVSRASIDRLKHHFSDFDVKFDDLELLSDVQLFERLRLLPFRNFHVKPVPDWNWVHEEMRAPDVTLELLWREWRRIEPNGIAYSQFTSEYRHFARKLPLAMRQSHVPGEKLFLDFCGKTMPVFIEGQTEPRYAQIFVAVLGYSSYTFARAVWTQTIEDWSGCHVQAFEFFSGTPQIWVPDNLKAAVTKHARDEVHVNLVYQQLANHYQSVIIPARPRRPKEKAKVEAGVKVIQRWLLASLRHRRFFSLGELNTAIRDKLEEFNSRAFRRLENTSRQSQFLDVEKAALTPLPSLPYEHANWRFNVKVRSDYMVEYEGHFYSVPSRLVGQQIDTRVTGGVVEIFHNHLRVCTHVRQTSVGMSVIPEHRPPNHQYFADSEPQALLAWGNLVGPSVLRHLTYHLTERSDVASGRKAASALRKEARLHGSERLEEACTHALTLNTFALKSVQSILREQPDKRPSFKSPPASAPAHENLRGPQYFAEN